MSRFPTLSPTLPDLDGLLQDALSGDAVAVDVLFDRFTGYLTMLTTTQVGPRLRRKLDPDDIVQETLLEAHRQFPQFRGRTGRELIGWVRRILAGQLALTLRRYLGTKRRDVRMERECGDCLNHSAETLDRALIAVDPNPSTIADQNEQVGLLSSALDRLPEDYREVIVLRQMEALTFGETARRMGRSEDAVQKLWIRALTNLRREFRVAEAA
ncbi:MAG TPA: sigma-70 family RNA polymerase sigma factor [Phycisphaerae bacterium]|jgi:RNA polymerase sigma-70 factor (ECF subfamily)|nr:sigma-70 family RNA polymerase sigma factor [Phycisphaerae bacterium]